MFVSGESGLEGLAGVEAAEVELARPTELVKLGRSIVVAVDHLLKEPTEKTGKDIS